MTQQFVRFLVSILVYCIFPDEWSSLKKKEIFDYGRYSNPHHIIIIEFWNRCFVICVANSTLRLRPGDDCILKARPFSRLCWLCWLCISKHVGHYTIICQRDSNHSDYYVWYTVKRVFISHQMSSWEMRGGVDQQSSLLPPVQGIL